jgi:hypothetical protein
LNNVCNKVLIFLTVFFFDKIALYRSKKCILLYIIFFSSATKLTLYLLLPLSSVLINKVLFFQYERNVFFKISFTSKLLSGELVQYQKFLKSFLFIITDLSLSSEPVKVPTDYLNLFTIFFLNNFLTSLL